MFCFGTNGLGAGALLFYLIFFVVFVDNNNVKRIIMPATTVNSVEKKMKLWSLFLTIDRIRKEIIPLWECPPPLYCKSVLPVCVAAAVLCSCA